MKWLVGLALIAGSSYFIYARLKEQSAPPEPPMPAKVLTPQPEPLLSADQIRGIRKSAADPDPNVRWSALQLLFTFRDPESVKLLEKAIAEDPDPDLRMKAIRLLKDAKEVDKVPGLVAALKDTDPDVRLASLKALAEAADPAATPWVVEVVRDPDPDVRVQALQTLGRFEEKRKRDFQALAEGLRKQYEEAIKKTQKTQEQKQPWNSLE